MVSVLEESLRGSKEEKCTTNNIRTYHPFYNDTYDILMHHEAHNLIPLGNILIGMEGTDKIGYEPICDSLEVSFL
jgi:hypothetical protein